MLDHIHHLSEEEKNLVLQAPVYVSLLIAGADGHVQLEEQQRILELVHTKTF
jgi:tellurite resistance protein